MDLATLFCEEYVQSLEMIARFMALETMVETKDGFSRVSNVWVAMKNPKFQELIESQELLDLVLRFKALKPLCAKNYHQECALKQLHELYGGDIWQWTLDAFEGNSDEDLCPSVLSLVSRAW